MSVLERDTQTARMKRAEKDKSTVSTGKHYTGHVGRYVRFWERDQEQRKAKDPSWVAVPPFPMIATKAALFIEHEMQREKVSTHTMMRLSFLLY